MFIMAFVGVVRGLWGSILQLFNLLLTFFDLFRPQGQEAPDECSLKSPQNPHSEPCCSGAGPM